MNLRLNTLAQMVDPGSRVADIGTDHAYLPIELVKNKQINYAIASDIAKGPLQNAKDDIAEAGLQGKIETRLGPGLSTVNHNDDIDTVVIAGMGGKLITDILDDAWNKHFCFKTLILEPNIGEPGVRKWLIGHKYQIVTEKLIVESGHTYELIKARAVKKRINLSEKKILFGPYILKEKNSIFYQKWENQLAYHKKLLLDLNKAKKKDLQHINQVKQEIKLIEGELNDKS